MVRIEKAAFKLCGYARFTAISYYACRMFYIIKILDAAALSIWPNFDIKLRAAIITGAPTVATLTYAWIAALTSVSTKLTEAGRSDRLL